MENLKAYDVNDEVEFRRALISALEDIEIQLGYISDSLSDLVARK
jgi:hypothetical protein